MISYFRLQKNNKKNRDVPKLGQNWAESCQNWQKLLKNWYYVHFDPKNYIKNQKKRLIQNKEKMISYCQLTKIEKIIRDIPKLGQKLSKLAKNCKKLVKNWYYVHFDTKKNIKILK